MKVMLDESVREFVPARAHSTDAGIDLFAAEDVFIPARGSAVIHTGTHVQLPPNAAGVLISKSGLNVKHGITSTGLIDEGYTGEILVKLYNNSYVPYEVKRGNKVTQLMVVPVLYEPVEVVESFDGNTERGDNGFGSTGE